MLQLVFDLKSKIGVWCLLFPLWCFPFLGVSPSFLGVFCSLRSAFPDRCFFVTGCFLFPEPRCLSLPDRCLFFHPGVFFCLAFYIPVFLR